MKRPEHPWIVATMEAVFRRSGISEADGWAYVDRRKAPPPEVRDAIVATYFPRVPPESFLPSSAENNTLNTMNASQEIEPARMGRPLKAQKHPFVVALLREGKTVAEVAKDLGRAKSTVQAWYKPKGDPGLRPIPRAAADVLRKRLGVPLSAWARIAD